MLPWVKLDDGFAEHPKIIDLSDRALRLHVAALCYSARNLTDGVLVVRSIETCCALTRATRRHTTELTDAGLWTAHADGFLIRDFLDYNPSSAKVKSDRSAARERMKTLRGSREQNANGVDRTNGERSATGRSGTPSRPLKKSTSAFIAEAIDQSLKAS